MIDVRSLTGQTVAVFGLGRSGLASALALVESGAHVAAWDDNPSSRDDAADQGVPLVDPYVSDWSQPVALVFSPGIPQRYPQPHAIAAMARQARVEIICDIELLARSQPQATLLGVTGTNGKSTTTALIGDILEMAGSPVQVGGNLGTPALELNPLGEDGTYVMEVSSYQLDLLSSAVFDIAVLLNLSPDHLHRHGGMAGYIEAKKIIFRGQGSRHTAIIGIDDEPGREIYRGLQNRGVQTVIPVSGHEAFAGAVYVVAGVLFDNGTAITDLSAVPSLAGDHNGQNAAAAYAACRAAGLSVEAIIAGLKSFPGLAHRQQRVSVVDGVTYVNDSKATNVAAAVRALACYRDIYWIAGGRAKQGGYGALGDHLDHVRQVFLIGEAASDMATVLADHVPCTRSENLTNAVAQARQAALAAGGGVVLLSPACASFDQFSNFEARGDFFRALCEGPS